MGVQHSIMWRLVVFTVVILSSTTSACNYKQVQIDNQLDASVDVKVSMSVCSICLCGCSSSGKIDSGKSWTVQDIEPVDYDLERGPNLERGLVTRITASGKDVKCEDYTSTGTGYWHFKVEYKDKEKGNGECKVTSIPGLS